MRGITNATLVRNIEHKRSEERGTLAPSNLRAMVRRSYNGAIEADATYEDICFTNLRIAGSIDGDGIWTVAADYVAKSASESSPTLLAERSVNLIRFADTRLYIDDQGGTIGTTEITDAFIGFELNVNTNRHLKHFGGSLDATTWGERRWEGSLSLTLELTPQVKAFLSNLDAATDVTGHLIRIVAQNGSLEARIDFAGFLPPDAVSMPDEREGNVTVTLPFAAEYNGGLGTWLDVTVVNNVATLP